MTPAGWYGDPADPSLMRYWDGTAWTAHVHPVPAPEVVAASTRRPVAAAVLADPDPATVRDETLSDVAVRRLAAVAPPRLEAAWYEDPLHRLNLRWWDGRAWTGRIAPRPLGSIPADPAERVALADLGREGVHWPSPREIRYLDRCAPSENGWYLDPLAPALRGRRWERQWTDQVRPRRDVVLGHAPASGAPSGYGGPEDVARTRRSRGAWLLVGAFFLLGGLAALVDPRGSRSLLPLLLGVAALVRAYVMHAKLRDLGQD